MLHCKAACVVAEHLIDTSFSSVACRMASSHPVAATMQCLQLINGSIGVRSPLHLLRCHWHHQMRFACTCTTIIIRSHCCESGRGLQHSTLCHHLMPALRLLANPNTCLHSIRNPMIIWMTSGCQDQNMKLSGRVPICSTLLHGIRASPVFLEHRRLLFLPVRGAHPASLSKRSAHAPVFLPCAPNLVPKFHLSEPSLACPRLTVHSNPLSLR